MDELKKQLQMTMRTFVVLLLVMVSLASLACYLSFDQNYREVKQSAYAVMCDQIISDMETSLQYGKRLDRYYGIDAVLENTQSLFDEGLMDAGILDQDGALLYSTFEDKQAVRAIVESAEAQGMATTLPGESGYQLLSRDGYEVLMLPIMDEETQLGSFVLAYPTQVYDAQRAVMQKTMLSILPVVIGVGLIALALYRRWLCRRLAAMDDQRRTFFMFRVPSGLLILLVLVTGAANYVSFQTDYEQAIREDVASVVDYVGTTTQALHEKGVAYEDMEGLETYLADKVAHMPVVEDLRLAQVLYDSQTVRQTPQEDVVQVTLKDGEMPLRIEATLSDDYLQQKMQEMFLLFLAMFVFSIVIIYEMTRLPAMFSQRRSKRHGELDDGGTYDYISSSIRLMAFLRTLGNYMYVPYSALLIKQWDQAVGGLSVGVTAALPLSVEGAAQMIGLLLFPIWVKRPDKTSRRFFTLCFAAMMAINIGCFLTHSAWVIIVLRFFGGFAYAGFMYTLNMVVANGDGDDAQRQRNLSQSNAGIIGGNMCGAGIGAVIAALAGYSFSYIASAVVFALFGVFVLYLLPWRFLEENARRKEAAQPVSDEKVPLGSYLRIIFSPSVLRYFVLVMVPVFFGVLFTATLIPTVTAERGTTILLSYCYIANGLAGFYLGPVVVRALQGRVSTGVGVSGALVLGAGALALLEVPPFFVMVLLSSALLGVFDGYGSPLATDGFLSIPAVKGRVNAVTALALYMTLSSLVMTLAPVFIEMLTQISMTVAVLVLSGFFFVCAVLFFVTNGERMIGKSRRT